MGRKAALALLLIAILWGAMPALACLGSTMRRPCCRAMATEHCCPSEMMNSGGCCQVQPEAAVLPPALANIGDPGVALTQGASRALPLPSAVSQGAMLLPPETSPPPGSSGAGSILRI